MASKFYILNYSEEKYKNQIITVNGGLVTAGAVATVHRLKQ
jgi:hypothetical protein